MTRVLAVSDEVVARLWTEQVTHAPVDVIVAAGDLPFDYLAYLSSTLDRPCVFVPGNHDMDLSGYRSERGLWTRAGMPTRWPGPAGATNADLDVVEIAGLRIAGLGGSIRYSNGPNQWTERQQAHRMRRVARLVRRRQASDGHGVDILLTHAPPRDCGDQVDPPHRGFSCFHEAVRRIRPRVMIHGHIHPHGQPLPDRNLYGTRIINAVGYKILDLEGIPDPIGVRDGT